MIWKNIDILLDRFVRFSLTHNICETIIPVLRGIVKGVCVCVCVCVWENLCTLHMFFV